MEDYRGRGRGGGRYRGGSRGRYNPYSHSSSSYGSSYHGRYQDSHYNDRNYSDNHYHNSGYNSRGDYGNSRSYNSDQSYYSRAGYHSHYNLQSQSSSAAPIESSSIASNGTSNTIDTPTVSRAKPTDRTPVYENVMIKKLGISNINQTSNIANFEKLLNSSKELDAKMKSLKIGKVSLLYSLDNLNRLSKSQELNFQLTEEKLDELNYS